LLLEGDQIEVDDRVAYGRSINLVGPGVDLRLDLLDPLGAESARRLGKRRKFYMIGAWTRRRSRGGFGMRGGCWLHPKAFVCWLNPHSECRTFTYLIGPNRANSSIILG
jgi:hypothetical protein